jgi:cobalt-zinc-cadmium resistance protein CzcA
LEIASVLPDFNVGYFNQSLIGTQTISGEEVYFDKSKRFHGWNVGISIPLTFFSNTSKIKSLSYKQQELLKDSEYERVQLQTQLENAFSQYNQNLLQYNYFQSTALPKAEIIISTALLGFNSGNIGYIEFLQALETASDVELNSLQSINQLNQSIININYLINN